VVASNDAAHRFPFVLDGIFKEDLEDNSRDIILKFIARHRPKDTQTVISIADAKEMNSKVEEYNSKYFQGEARLIMIGEGVREKGMLSPHKGEQEALIQESIAIMAE